MKTKHFSLTAAIICIASLFSINLAYGYHPISPYAYVKNNPVRYVDPDGQVVRIANNIAGSLEIYAKIAATSQGAGMMSRLTGSQNVYEAKSIFLTFGSDYNDHTGEIRFGGNPWLPRLDGGSVSGMTNAGHETYHAYQDDTGQVSRYNGEMRNVVGLEKGAVRFENYLRSVYDDGPMRESYSGLPGGQGARGVFMPGHSNTEREKITNFTAIGNNEGKTSFGFSYDKQVGKGNAQTYYIVVSVDDKKNFNFQIYNTEDAYKKATSNW